MRKAQSILLAIFLLAGLASAQDCPQILTEELCFVNQFSWGAYEVQLEFSDTADISNIDWSSADTSSGEDIIELISADKLRPTIALKSLFQSGWLIAEYKVNENNTCRDSILIKVNDYPGACLALDPFYPKNCSDTIRIGMLCNLNYPRFERTEWSPEIYSEEIPNPQGLNSGLRVWPNERTVYNLKAVDEEGCIHFEEHVVGCLSHTNEKISHEITVYPNPASHILYIQIVGKQENSGQFILRNALGQVVTSEKLQSAQTHNEIDIQDLLPGIYFYEISNKRKSVKSGRLVVQ